MALPTHDRDTHDRATREEAPRAQGRSARETAPPPPAPEVLAQMATPIYAALITRWAHGPTGTLHDDMANSAIERAQDLWVMAHAAPTAPPVNTAVPMVSQDGNMLLCTMGVWDGEPSGYSYQWQLDGADVGTSTGSYTIRQPEDIGRKGTCLVTARNGLGETVAPVSNEVVVEKPAP